MNRRPEDIYSIGHSNLSYRQFAGLLRKHGVEMVVDIRTIPYSKHVCHFNFETLRSKLAKSGISYEYLGNELGTDNVKASQCLTERAVGLSHFARQAYLEGMSKLEELASKHRVAIMCAEGRPYTCHRHTVLAEDLRSRGLEMSHIFSDGRAVSARSCSPMPQRTKSGKFTQRGLFDVAVRDVKLTEHSPLRKVA